MEFKGVISSIQETNMPTYTLGNPQPEVVRGISVISLDLGYCGTGNQTAVLRVYYDKLDFDINKPVKVTITNVE